MMSRDARAAAGVGGATTGHSLENFSGFVTACVPSTCQPALDSGGNDTGWALGHMGVIDTVSCAR